MCGIAGKIGNAVTYSSDEPIAVLKSLQHRGPDSQNFIEINFGYLAHTRLSIIDTDTRSNQPFRIKDSEYVLVFNGEIYNYIELKTDLQNQGVNFKTESDTEVLFHLLAREGSGCLNKLNGFFALGFLNLNSGDVLLAIDRFGMKPLFYSQANETLHFASEMKALLAMLEDAPSVNSDSLSHLIQYSFVPVQECALEGVKKLQPGQCLEVKSQQIILFNWYREAEMPAKKGIENLMTEAVHARLVSDVPLGCFLSGGLDSSIIAALACRQMQGLRTFSIGFSDSTFLDESAYAQLVADHLGTDHQTFFLSENEAASNLKDYLQAMDEPFGDSSSFAMYLLCQKASQHVKVVLSGDGSDELFAGYNRHRAFFRWLNPGLVERGIALTGGLLQKFDAGRSSAVSNKIRQAQKFARLSQLNAQHVYKELSKFASEKELSEVLSVSPSEIEFGPFRSGRELLDYLKQDQEFILPGDMLVKTDRMGMAHGLEVRTPFLDHHVVEWARQQKSEVLINRSQGKLCLREVFGHLLPESILRRPKRGFEIPLEKWIPGVWRKEIEHALRPENIRSVGVCRPEGVQMLLSNTIGGKGNVNLVWSIFVLHHWMENHYSSSPSNLSNASSDL